MKEENYNAAFTCYSRINSSLEKKINTHHLYTNNDGKRSYC